MAQKTGADGRSMGEILASIRDIVTEEERARRETDAAGRGSGGGASGGSDGGAAVLLLREDMRVAAYEDGDEDAREVEAASDLELGSLRASTRAGHEIAPVGRGEGGDLPAPTALTENQVEQIVRRIVLEELKGPIGQQISRKVKGLVADEVRRAMDEEDDGLV